MLKIYNSNYRINLIVSYAALSFLTIILIILSQTFLITEDIYYRSLGERLSLDQISQILSLKSKYEFFSYIFLIVLNLLKCATIALTLYTGAVLFGFKLTFKGIFKVVIISEFIFLIPLVLKFIWFYFFQSNFTLEDLQFFYPLSLLNVFDTGTISQLWVYPLQLLNIFEVAYWFLLAFGIKQLINSDFDKSLRLVLCSYLPAMLLWVVFVMFLTVTLNPNI